MNTKRLFEFVGLVLLLVSCSQAQVEPLNLTTPVPSTVLPSPTTTPLTPTPKPTPLPPATTTPVPPAYWPTNGWRGSSPEEQGMDSATLVEMLANIQEQAYPIHSLIIIRNGYMVMEAYFHPYQADLPHDMASVTKSVTSALIGLAVKQGYIDRINHPLLDFFPKRAVANLDARKQAVTLEHLLTMSSGLDWPVNDMDDPIAAQILHSTDWVQFALDRPMAQEPGTTFSYNSAGSHVLMAVIQKTTGMTPLNFAKENLFKPLGISQVFWPYDPNGINTGGWGLKLTPRDMAKLGYLYLNNGVWAGQSIIPAEWVKASSTAAINPPAAGPRYGSGYGYQWWVEPGQGYKAAGAGGQRIFVLPQQNMVVVFVGDIVPVESQVPETILESYILPAVKSADPLPTKTEQTALLETRLQALANPAPKPVPPLPAMAQRISGKLYTLLQESPLGIKGFALNFQGDQALFKAFSMFDILEVPVGLDDVYRFTPLTQPDGSPGFVAMKGVWTSDDTFAFSMFLNNKLSTMSLVFKDDEVEMTSRDASGEQTLHGVRQLTYPTPSASNIKVGQQPYSSQVQIQAADHTTQTIQVNYLLYLPETYDKDSSKKWPLILFLHGIGERGVDIDAIKKHPLPEMLEQQADFPFIVVSPQLSLETDTWSAIIDPLDTLLNQLQTIYAIDPQRIYVTGMSMGGFGTWEFALRHPQRIAAAVPIAGGYKYENPTLIPDNICTLKNVPMWIFHGAKDEVFAPIYAKTMVEALTACGGQAKFTLYPNANHEVSFLRAYADPELFEWLLAQTKP